MKYKTLLFTSRCLLASYTSFAQQTPQPPPNVEELYDYLRAKAEEVGVSKNPPVDILFFDINHDGIPEALGSIREDQQGGGCHGNDWSIYQLEKGEWQWVPTRDSDEYGIFARGDDFFSLTEEGQKPKLILLYSCSGREDEGMRYSQEACEITIDSEGYLKTIPIPALTVNCLGKYNEEEEAYEVYMGDLKMREKLVPLPIVTLLSQRDEGKEVAVSRLVAAFDQRRSEALARLAAEEVVGKATASPPNRLWLYVGILLALSTLVYLVRRKLKTGN